ncbi:MAG: FAD-dependent oxidoreductase [Acidobacteriota bacterium]|nr:FAD-dependent oxidoreductase [Acidobacteriota bacterium]
MATDQTYDVAVVGAGVFGAWTAYQLSRAGKAVVLVDAYGPGNSRSSSGGESRVIRMGYGPDQIYTRMAQRSLVLWKELLGSSALFQASGVLWLAQENDAYCEATLETLRQANVRLVHLDRDELARRYPQLNFEEVAWGIFEPDSGVILARRAVQAVVEQARKSGTTYLEEAVLPQEPGTNDVPAGTTAAGAYVTGKLNAIRTSSGRELGAQQFVFACGPWLPKLFPMLLADLIHVTRQEVFFFGVPTGASLFGPECMPAWIDFNKLIYGLPNLENRGVKLAIDAHGPKFDPDAGDRIVSNEGLTAVRTFLRQRIPLLANAPVTETRVCQYENTSNGDFLIDRHPEFENVWLVGGGSGHGFKHGPAVGEAVAALVSGIGDIEPRFGLTTKKTLQQRRVY